MSTDNNQRLWWVFLACSNKIDPLLGQVTPSQIVAFLPLLHHTINLGIGPVS